MAVSDYSTTPGSNSSISGINIAENCPAGNMNGAFRQLMADIRVLYNALPVTADLVAKSGGSFTTNPVYTGRGGYIYHNDAGNTSGRVFVQALGGGTPAGMANGDWLAEY